MPGRRHLHVHRRDFTRPRGHRRAFVIGAGGHPFSLVASNPGVAVTGGQSSQSLRMKTGVTASWGADSYGYIGQGVTDPDPRGVQVMPDGGVLVADAANSLVLRMDTDGQVVWAYTKAQDDQLQSPVSARRLEDGTYLIVDRDAQRVLIVGLNGGLRWQYGTTGVAGSGVDQLDSPTYADVRPDGDITICDAGNHRVIVVRRSDYDSASRRRASSGSMAPQASPAPALTSSSVRRSIQWLTLGSADGNALISDEGAGRVIEVRASDHSDGFSETSVVWEYPVPAADLGSRAPPPACTVATASCGSATLRAGTSTRRDRIGPAPRPVMK